MKRKLTIGTLVLVMLLLATTLAGCSIGMDSVEDILEKNDLVAQITYYSNGGWFGEESAKIFSRDLYYKEDARPFEITNSTAIKLNSAEDVYAGWYRVKTVQKDGQTHFVCDLEGSSADAYSIDGRGAVVSYEGQYVIGEADYETLLKQEKAPKLALGDEFNFNTYEIKKGDMIYLAAGWVPNQKIEYVLITEGCSEITLESGEKYADRSIVATALFDKNGKYTVPTDYNLTPIKDTITDATFVDYYYYEEGADVNNLTLLVEKYPEKKIDSPADGNLKVFVKYTAGANWNVVRFPSDVKAMFRATSSKFYVSRDINCSSEKAYSFALQGINRVNIKGNGHTITGIKMQTDGTISGGSAVSLFGKVTAEAKIEDVTFENVTLTVTTKASNTPSYVNVYLLAHALNAQDAYPTFSNVAFNNVTVDVTLANNCSVENILEGNDGYDTTKWLMVGKTNATLLTEGGVTIENYELIINTVIVSTNK